MFLAMVKVIFKIVIVGLFNAKASIFVLQAVVWFYVISDNHFFKSLFQVSILNTYIFHTVIGSHVFLPNTNNFKTYFTHR